jgi:hypothetical protein
MADELTDEEREFLTEWQHGIAGALGLEATAVDEVQAAARHAVDAITERWPSRTHRLAVLAALARECRAEREKVLDDVLESRYQWVLVTQGHNAGEWRALGWQTYEERGLVAISGLSASTIRSRIKGAVQRTYDAARAAHAERPQLPEATQ